MDWLVWLYAGVFTSDFLSMVATVALSSLKYFAEGEYLLADSAYSACKYIVQSFKKVSGESSLHPQKEAFNTAKFMSNQSIT